MDHFNGFLPESQSLLDPNPVAAAASKGSRNARIFWSDEMTATLLETLKVQQDRGKRSDSGWKPEAWIAAREAVIRASRNRTHPSIAQVKSKVDNLKLLWRKWVEIEMTSGFGWSEERELYEADDYVWENYLKSNKTARWHRNNTLHNRDVLAILFPNIQANGNGVVSTSVPINDAGVVDTTPNNQEQRKSQKYSSKKPTSAGLEDALAQMKDEMARQRRMLGDQNSSRSKPERAVALLYADYENRLDLDSFVKAMDLVENESKASLFLVMKPGDKRDRWLELHLDTELEPLEIE